MKKKRYRRVLAGIAAAALLAAGCGQAGSGAASASSTSSGSLMVSSSGEAGNGAPSSVEAVTEDTSAGEAVHENSSSEGTVDGDSSGSADAETLLEEGILSSQPEDAPAVDGLTYVGTMNLRYAKCFQVYYYEGGWRLLSIPDGDSFLVAPDGQEAPKGLSDAYTVIHRPSAIYLAATSAYALFDALGAENAVTLSGTDKSGWTIDAPKEALENGTMTFAGKYNEPDYELLVDKGCDLAIESTMILHSPEVKEMIEDLDIPVLTDRSSYETEALGRTEWIKLYGALMGKEEEAFSFFNEQAKVLDDLSGEKSTGKTAVFFAVDTDGSIVVRAGNDYISNMIDEGGAKYIYDDLKNTGTAATVTLSMEQFYKDASDADYLIYNATIEQSLGSIDDLVAKNDLFGDFRAVKDGNVFQVDRKMYQSTDKVAQFIRDVNLMVTGGDEKEMTFLSRLS